MVFIFMATSKLHISGILDVGVASVLSRDGFKNICGVIKRFLVLNNRTGGRDPSGCFVLLTFGARVKSWRKDISCYLF